MTRSDTADGLIAEQIRRGINRSGMSNHQVEAFIGVGRGYIWAVLNGRHRLPHPVAVLLSELLVWPRIAEVSLEQNMATCPIDGRRFLISGGKGGRHKRFCSRTCQVTAYRRSIRDSRERAGTLAEHRLVDHALAVSAYCHGCSPDGLCNDATCALRPVSPFPLTRALPVLLMPLQGRPPKRQDERV